MVVAPETEKPRKQQPPVFEVKNGANDPDRTDDLIITNDLLYQLSYVGFRNRCHYSELPRGKSSAQDEKKEAGGLTT
jgi:hypothetical protein